ncbi:MAG TPA: tetratricopeptide repeat protein [Bacteroidota bacterium]|jgi:hypothetical protein|nr:tetratricopeptide repeat protein [Bacteroidota bacterium]
MNAARTAVLLILLWCTSSSVRADAVRWLIDVDDAKRQAFADHKLILMLFEYASFDRSAKMTSEVWNQDTIIGLSRNFVCLRVDLEQMEASRNILLKDKNQKLIVRYRVTSVPVAVIIDATGNLLLTFNDENSLREIIGLLHSVPTDLNNLYAILQSLDRDKDNVRLKIAAGDEYQNLHISHLSNSYYEEVEDEDTVKNHPLLSERIRSSRAVNLDRMGKSGEAIDIFERLVDEQPPSENRPFQLYMLTKLYAKRLKEIRARDYYNILRKDYPQSEFTLKAWEVLKD